MVECFKFMKYISQKDAQELEEANLSTEPSIDISPMSSNTYIGFQLGEPDEVEENLIDQELPVDSLITTSPLIYNQSSANVQKLNHHEEQALDQLQSVINTDHISMQTKRISKRKTRQQHFKNK